MVEIPKVTVRSTPPAAGHRSRSTPSARASREEIVKFYRKGEAYAAGLGVQMLNTCTPYRWATCPRSGEHCAWMESSAVIYMQLGAGRAHQHRRPREHRRAMLTGKIPYWGYHLDENRLGTHHVELDIEVESTADWGLLGYYIGDVVQDRVPVISAASRQVPEPARG